MSQTHVDFLMSSVDVQCPYFFVAAPRSKTGRGRELHTTAVHDQRTQNARAYGTVLAMAECPKLRCSQLGRRPLLNGLCTNATAVFVVNVVVAVARAMLFTVVVI